MSIENMRETVASMKTMVVETKAILRNHQHDRMTMELLVKLAGANLEVTSQLLQVILDIKEGK